MDARAALAVGVALALDVGRNDDDRVIAGAAASKTFFGTAPGGVKSETTVGFQSRYDDIVIGLFNTKQRATLSTVRDDMVREASVGVFGEHTLRWSSGCAPRRG